MLSKKMAASLFTARVNGCKWDAKTCASAAQKGHLEELQWARANGCDWDCRTCVAATQGGFLEVLQWARANGWSEFYALEGLSQLILTVREVREALGTELFIDGVVLTMFDRRVKLAQQVEIDVRDNLKSLVYKTIIPRTVRLSEAPSYGETILEYDALGRGAEAYIALGDEFLKRDKKKQK